MREMLKMSRILVMAKTDPGKCNCSGAVPSNIADRLIETSAAYLAAGTRQASRIANTANISIKAMAEHRMRTSINNITQKQPVPC